MTYSRFMEGLKAAKVGPGPQGAWRTSPRRTMPRSRDLVKIAQNALKTKSAKVAKA